MRLRRRRLLSICQPWTTDAAVRACTRLDESYDTSGAIALASEVLFALSGSRWPGDCGERTVRPCGGGNRGCLDFRSNTYFEELAPVGTCSRRCEFSTVRLLGPVSAITSVTVDGELIDPSQYRLKRQHNLVRIDGERWPCSQDLTLPSTEEDTFEVVYERGADPPAGGVEAATQLASLFAADSCGGDCGNVSWGLRSTTREGNHWEYVDIGHITAAGKTGVNTVDFWLSAVNPYGRRRQAAIFGTEDVRGRA